MATLTEEQLAKLINLGNLQTFKTKLEEKIDDTYAKKTDLSYKADAQHNHEISEVGGLQDALDSKATVESVANLLNGTTSVDKAIKAQRDYDGNVISETYAKKSDLSSKADADHDHEIGEVNGLQDALDGKASAESVTNIVNGTTVVGKAKEDDAGNVISTTYAKATVVEGIADDYNDLETRVQNIEDGTVAVGKATNAEQLGGKAASEYALNSALSYKADAQHNHEISEVGGLQDALDAKASAESVTNIVNGTTKVGKAEVADSANLATQAQTAITAMDSSKLGGVLASSYFTKSDVASTTDIEALF